MTEVPEEILAKEANLKHILEDYDSLAIAFSGGADSAYLADVAYEVIGEKVRLLLGDSPSMPRSELTEAKQFAQERGWKIAVITTQEFENENFMRNDAKRCYICKTLLFAKMRRFTLDNNIMILAHGENADDTADTTRTGQQAAREFGVVAPLQLAKLTKQDIRLLSQRRGLPTWNKPSFACLCTRFPTGTRLTLSDVAEVEEAENVLKRIGFRQYRVRHHGELCRIELEPDDLPNAVIPENRATIVREFRKIGFRHITLDLAGYRTGGANFPTEEDGEEEMSDSGW